ncbi:hypothetical protein [Eubacterium ramulus]
MATKHWTSHRRPVYVGSEIETIWTSWGYPYSLYKEKGTSRYFADISEGFGEVEEIKADSEEEAKEIFKSWMQALEEEIKQAHEEEEKSTWNE